MKKNRVALLYICTGKYDMFWKDFFLSFEKYFLKNSIVEYFVFTDAKNIYMENECARIHKIKQKPLEWPYTTLLRFDIFYPIINNLKEFDYVFFMNATMICSQRITEEEFLPIEEDLLVVQHPVYYDKKPKEYPYDRNKESLAYISENEGKYYVCGGVNGGKAKAFIELIIELRDRTKIDLQNKVIARWHDESHLNRYIIDNPNYKMLSPSFCYPEEFDIPFENKIMVLGKRSRMDIDKIKRPGIKELYFKLYWKIKKLRRNA